MKTNNTLLIKCFGTWWTYDQSWSDSPPQLAQDILELADIVYYPPQNRTIKNRYNESFEGPITMRMWLGEDVPDLESREFRDEYVKHIVAINKKLNNTPAL